MTISKQEIFALFKYNASKKYTVFQEHIKEFQKQVVVLDSSIKKKTSIVLVPTVNWSTEDNNNEVEFYFNEHIMPYLIEFKNNFTQYDILELKDMKSQYSIILYKWLVMEHNKRLSKAKNDIVEVEISMDKLRTMTATEEKYIDFRNFRRKVINKAKNEINKSNKNGVSNTSFLVEYEPIKQHNGKIVSIKFMVRKRNSAMDHDFFKPTKKIQNPNTPKKPISSDEFQKAYYEKVAPDQMTLDDINQGE